MTCHPNWMAYVTDCKHSDHPKTPGNMSMQDPIAMLSKSKFVILCANWQFIYGISCPARSERAGTEIVYIAQTVLSFGSLSLFSKVRNCELVYGPAGVF